MAPSRISLEFAGEQLKWPLFRSPVNVLALVRVSVISLSATAELLARFTLTMILGVLSAGAIVTVIFTIPSAPYAETGGLVSVIASVAKNSTNPATIGIENLSNKCLKLCNVTPLIVTSYSVYMIKHNRNRAMVILLCELGALCELPNETILMKDDVVFQMNHF